MTLAKERLASVDVFDQVLHGRRSTRRYKPDPVRPADLAAVIEAARWAPSPHNAEMWRFAILKRPETKERLAAAMGARLAADLRADGQPPELIEKELRVSRRRITEAPVVLVACICDDGLDPYPDSIRRQAEQTMAAHSLGAAMQSLMLAAYARGLGSCWMCAPLFCQDTVIEALRLPAEWRPQGLITLGFPVSWPEARERRPMPELTLDVD
jgi:coenzyme F420-0:L-glutamate ligase / coenzyme F420-1:gamma-L-glutamate ligase